MALLPPEVEQEFLGQSQLGLNPGLSLISDSLIEDEDQSISLDPQMKELLLIEDPTDAILYHPAITKEDLDISQEMLVDTMKENEKAMEQTLLADVYIKEIESQVDMAIKAFLSHEVNKRSGV